LRVFRNLGEFGGTEIIQISSNVSSCVPKMNKSLAGFEQHSNFHFWTNHLFMTVYLATKKTYLSVPG